MNNKKIISLLCAAALSASSFAGLSMSVAADSAVFAKSGIESYLNNTVELLDDTQKDDSTLWSDTFNNAATGLILDGTSGTGPLENSEFVKGLKFVTTNRNKPNGDAGSYTDSENNYVYGGSYYMVCEKEDSSDKYLRLSFPVFGDFTTNGRWGHVDFEQAYTATETKDVVMDFDIRLTNALDHGNDSTKPVFRVGTFDTDAKTAKAVEINKETLELGDDWVHARIVTSSTGSKLYIDGVEKGEFADVTSLAQIGLYSPDGESCGSATPDLIAGGTQYVPDDGGSYADADKPTKTAIADLDNVVIYTADTGATNGTTATPGAEDQEGGATPTPTKAPTYIPTAPTLTAPSGVTGLEEYHFDNVAVKSWALSTAEQNITDIDGLNIHIGGRSSGGAVDTFSAVTKIKTGNAFQMQSCSYGTAGRAPRMNVVSSLKAANGVSTVMTFNVYLSAAKGYEEDGQPRLFFLKDATQQGSDSTGAYRNVAAVLTAVKNEKIYRGDDSSSDVISTYVTPNEWHTVTFIVTPGDGGATHRLYVDGATEPAVKASYVATGENATYMDDLPMLTTESKAAKVSGVDQSPSRNLVTIDDLLVYQGTADEPKRLLPTVEEAPVVKPTATMTLDETAKTVTMTADQDCKAVLIQASYKSDGMLDAVKTLKEVTLTANTPVTETLATLNVGDKIMLWDGMDSMSPLAEGIASTGGDSQATPDPTKKPEESTPTPVPGGDATPTPGSDATPTPTPGSDVTPTPVPGGDATPTPTPGSDVTPTPTSYAIAKAENIVGGTVEIDKQSAKAGDTVTITAAPSDGYKFGKITVTPDSVTVSATADGKYTFTMPASNVTVGAEFTAVYAVAVAEGITGGTVTVDKKTAAAGEEVTVTATPNSKYLLDKVTVKDADNNDVEVKDGKFTMPAKAVTVSATFVADTAIYRAKITTSAQVTYSLTASDCADTASVTAEEVAKSNVADFGTATDKTAAVAALDGWGYMHYAYTSMDKDGTFQSGRQSNAHTDAAANALFVQNVGNIGSNGAISFIPANCADVTLPTEGKIVYTFDAIATTTGGNQAGEVLFGLTSSADGTTVASVASTIVAASGTNNVAVTVPMVMTYSIENKTYTITANNKLVASGVSENPVTGIYAQGIAKYIKSGISNLVVTVVDSDNTATLESVDAANGTASVDGIEFKKDDTVTVTATAVAGKKVKAVTVTKASGGTVDVTAGADNKYTFTMPDENVTIKVEYDRADIATIEVSGATAASIETTEQYTAVVKAADGTVLTPADGEIVWSVTGATDKTTVDQTGKLTVDKDETTSGTNKTIKVVATVKDTEIKNEYTVTVTAAATYTITARTFDNGSVTVKQSKAAEGADVEVEASADKGYEVKGVYYAPVAPSVAIANLTAGVTPTKYELEATEGYTSIGSIDNPSDYSIRRIFITAEGLEEHENGNGVKGLWVGAGVTAPEGTKFAGYVFSDSADAITKADSDISWETEFTGDDNDGYIGFYVNGSKTKYAAVKMADGRVYRYAIRSNVNADDTADGIGATGDPVDESTAITADKDGAYKFTMPKYPVEVWADVDKANLAITWDVDNSVDESAWPSDAPAAAKVGDKIDVAGYLDYDSSKYEISEISYKGTAADSTIAKTVINKNTDGKYELTMPNEPITISVTFKEIVRLAYSSVSADGVSTDEFFANGVGKLNHNDTSKLSLVKVNISKEQGNSLKNAVLTFDSICTVSGKNSNVVIQRIDDIDIMSSTLATVKAAVTKGNVVTLSNSKDNAATKQSIDITNDLRETGGIATYAIFTATAREQQLSNFELTTTYGSDVAFSIKDVSEGDFDVTIKGTTDTAFTETVKVSNGSGAAILPAGEYTYELTAQNGYKEKSATAFTVTAEDSSVEIELEKKPMSAVTFAVTPATSYTVVVKNGEETVDPDTTGGLTYTLSQGVEYSVTVTPTGDDADSYDPKTETFTVADESTMSKTITLTEKTYSVVLSTEPGAVVKLNAGSATSGVAVAEQSATADAAGNVTFTVPKGDYTVDITSANKYLDSVTGKEFKVTAAGTQDYALNYKSEYANMIYGNDFAGVAKGTHVNSTALKGWAYDKIADAMIDDQSNYPKFSDVNAKDGNYLIIYTWTQGEGKYEYTASENIATAKFDLGYGNFQNAAGKNRGNANVNIKLGGTTIVALTTSTISTISIGNTKIQTDESADYNPYGKWLSYEVSVSGTTASVTIKDSDGEIVGTGTVELSSTDVKTIDFSTNSTWGACAVDNLELYKAAAE